MEKTFDGQRDNEEVFCVVRQHPLSMRKGLYILLFLTFFGCIPLMLFPLNLMMYYVLAGAFLMGMLIFLYHWIGWYFSVYIITNYRVRYVSQKGLFGKSIIELPLSKIQNISFAVKGISGELFKYGTIVLQTMVGDLVLDRISDPEMVYNVLQDIVNKEKGLDGKDYEKD